MKQDRSIPQYFHWARTLRFQRQKGLSSERLSTVIVVVQAPKNTVDAALLLKSRSLIKLRCNGDTVNFIISNFIMKHP